jgi:hypothetical protein
MGEKWYDDCRMLDDFQLGGCHMKKASTVTLFVGILVLTLMSCPSLGITGVDINIGVNFGLPPPVVIEAPPPVVVIPGTYVYFVPDLHVDIFFYQDYWYRRHEGRWYRADDYNGPWGHIEYHRVPRVMHHLPPDYRHLPPGHQRIPYRQIKTHWRTWEKEKHWDRHKPRHHDGRGDRREERWESNQDHGKGKNRHRDN